jgi:glycosyltransferase involved in cell wall biosynthesis
MIFYLFLGFLLYAVLLFVYVIIGNYLHGKQERESYDSTVELLDQITLVIPFRNESQRIQELLKSIKNSNSFPFEIIFVDDHSSDHGAIIIEKELQGINYRIIQMEEQEGKKYALRKAFAEVKTSFILTMDADVYFEQNYFDSFQQMPNSDLYILPLVITAPNFISRILEFDTLILNAFNVGLAVFHRPIVSSGANLLFNKEVFDSVDQFESHKDIASGDDIFLLKDFVKAKKEIKILSALNLRVYSPSPKNVKEYMHQRLRWLSKTPKVKDSVSNLFGFFQLSFLLLFIAVLLFVLVEHNWTLAVFIFCFKTVIDSLIFLPYFAKYKRLKTWLLFPLYSLLFPLYSFFILLLIPFFKTEWKGRPLQ